MAAINPLTTQTLLRMISLTFHSLILLFLHPLQSLTLLHLLHLLNPLLRLNNLQLHLQSTRLVPLTAVVLQWEVLALLVTVHVVRTLDHLLGTLTTMPMAARIQLRLTDALMHKAISGKRRLCLLFSQHLSTRLAFLTRTGKP